jgi:uncharacterized protein YdeI (BOF family)
MKELKFNMSRAKIIVACMLALCAIGAATSSAASAAEWKVGGKALVGKSSIAEKTTIVKSFVLTGGGVKITCTGLTVKGGFIEATAANGAESLEFTGCTAAPTTCKVPTTIKTKAVKSTASVNSTTKEDEITFEPASGKIFVEIVFTGEECALLGTQPVTGKVKTKAPGGLKETEKQKLVVNSSGELKLGVNAATLEGEVELTLASKAVWAFA